MLCRSYLYAGDREEGTRQALAHAEACFGEPVRGNPDVLLVSTGHFSADDARRVQDFARGASVRGKGKALVISAGRIFHEAQNALLKLLEEPGEDTMIALIVPSAGILLPTVRSRLQPLPGTKGRQDALEPAEAFLAESPAGQEKLVAKLLERAKSDDDEEKQSAREDARLLVESLIRAAYAARTSGKGSAELDAFLADLDRLVPVLHERAAPMKPIMEHLLITLPKALTI